MKRGWAHGAPCPRGGRRGALALVCPAHRRIHRPTSSGRFVQRRPRRSGASCRVPTRMLCHATLTKSPRRYPAHVMPSWSTDRAPWHTTHQLVGPPRLSLLHWPPVSPNLILLNRSGLGCDRIIGPTVSLKMMRRSSKLAVRLGMPSPDGPLSSLPSAPHPGLICTFNNRF